MPKRALLVGIDDYPTSPLEGCVEEAKNLGKIFERHDDDDVNYSCSYLTSDQSPVTTARLRTEIQANFSPFDGDVLFYFSGHGLVDNGHAFLVAQDAQPGAPGVLMNEVIELAGAARQTGSQSALIILDCCRAGAAGDEYSYTDQIPNTKVAEGVTILAASTPKQNALVRNGRSIFTELLVGGLKGGAANVRGEVSVGSLYAYVESSLGVREQRPVYKSYSKRFHPLRRCKPAVEDTALRALPKFFSAPGHQYQLNDGFENYKLCPDSKPNYDEQDTIVEDLGDPKKIAVRKQFKKYQSAGLLRPTQREDIFWAALYGECVVLTTLGEYYRNLAEKNML